MRAWWIAALLVPALAGCAEDGLPRGVPIVELTVPGADAAGHDRLYSFVLYGKPLVKDAERVVQVKLYADGDHLPDHFLEYTARPDAATQALIVIQSPSPYLRFEVIAEHQEVAYGWMDVEGCPSTGGELTIEVKDHRLHGQGDVELLIRDCPPPA